MEQEHQAPQMPWKPYPGAAAPEQMPPVPQPKAFPVGKREWGFGIAFLAIGMALCNFTLYGGFNLGFAIAAAASLLCAAGYLLSCGHRPGFYSAGLLALSVWIAAGFARSDDGFVKFVMLFFLLLGGNLGLCLLAGQNRRAPGTVASLLDAPRTAFALGVGQLPAALRGWKQSARSGSGAGKRGGALLLGLLLALPLLAVLVSLLTEADAAFAGLMQRLPRFDFMQLIVTLIWGTAVACVLYTRAAALHGNPVPSTCARPSQQQGLQALTVNTVLAAACLVYGVYLLSQLAYLVGGFRGILPPEYTVAQYARRGFFEMAWLCAINLSVVVLARALVRKESGGQRLLRVLCLFLGVMTLFLVCTASAKMLLYIREYGLTRLRVLTQVVMLWLGLTTAVVCVWLFVPRLPYMKVVLLAALLLGGAVLWADVDTQVARYNVAAYQAGTLEQIDVEYLSTLGDGAAPYLAELTQDSNPEVAQQAREALEQRRSAGIRDFRGWNYAGAAAEAVPERFPAPEA